jgi:pantoate--beta-alanine ligase
MVEDLNLGVAIEALPTVREPDGLALSSRNAYLNPDERKAALVLYQGLKTVQKLFSQGERQADLLLGEIRSAVAREPLSRIDYVEIVNPRTLEPISCIENQALVVLAVSIGKTRLIDNVNLSTG